MKNKLKDIEKVLRAAKKDAALVDKIKRQSISGTELSAAYSNQESKERRTQREVLLASK